MSAEQPKVIQRWIVTDSDGRWVEHPSLELAQRHMDVIADLWRNPKIIPAQLVLTSEPLWTESQVRAMVEDLLSAAMDGPYMPNVEAFNETAAKHGLKNCNRP